VKSEEELCLLCAHLVADRGDADDARALAADPELAAEIEGRLAACGLRLLVTAERPLVVLADDGDGLSELTLTVLARCTLALAEPGPAAGRRQRLSVHALWQELGRPHGYTEAFLRRSGLGPLEARGLLKVVKPEQRAAEAYVVAGPALAAVDVTELRARLNALTGRAA